MDCPKPCSANYVPLSPLSFLERAASVYSDRVSIVYGGTRYSWKQTHDRCLKLASALSQLKVGSNDVAMYLCTFVRQYSANQSKKLCDNGQVVAVAPNVPALYELHFGVPMAGAVLCALNTRLDAAILATLLEQLQARTIFVDYQFLEVVLQALEIVSGAKTKPLTLVLIPKSDHETSSTAERLPPGSLNYNRLLDLGRADFQIVRPEDECNPISVNYTSGSTGKPKGIVYSHRAAYLNSIAGIFRYDMSKKTVFLWTVDMFRCNGWCLTWAVAALGGTNICTRHVTAKAIFKAISLHKVTLFCGAPALLNLISEAPFEDQLQLDHKVEIIVAGALPPTQVLTKINNLGFNISHGYGMSEALGPVTVKPWKHDAAAKVELLEGNHNLVMEEIDVKDPVTMASVPPDGKTIGEVMLRGNAMMSGYFNNLKATQKAFKGGWFRTGDLGIRHPDGGYVQLKDRACDAIVSGGERISTLEVEAVVVGHPMVMEAVVVGKPDDLLGETPCAFVKLKEGCNVSSEEIIKFCMNRLPHHVAPQTVIFGNLPVNSTGKVQKFVLRERAKAIGNLAN
ncbi:hypothetical protein RJ639_008045 [Escallonia herrerae]|uniref:Acyl-activating enzyme 1, peroxisomal n=1 Tax=Escallonia herrerae TaxID=1293975 RepID=A0AA88VRL6_9ASTE|nr:hypothetical protein RJ639_008045 [Escallonia herrerae]